MHSDSLLINCMIHGGENGMLVNMAWCGNFEFSDDVRCFQSVNKDPTKREERESDGRLWDESLQVIWILVLSPHLPHMTAAKPWTLHF